MFNRETVYEGYSLEELAKARDVLGRNSIKYKVKIKNHSGSWLLSGSRRGTFGSAGMRSDYERQYEIVVHREDAEQAKYLIRNQK